jgi:hypothetical protein
MEENMRMKLALAVIAASLVSAPAYAAIGLGKISNGNAVYTGPTPTYDFDTTTPVTTGGGIIPATVSGLYAAPFGGSGKFFSVGPSTSPVGTINLDATRPISYISFVWGSVDAYNTIDVLDALGNVLATFTGAHAAINPNGDQSNPATNPVAKIVLSGEDRQKAAQLRLGSTSNAFEIDDIAVGVPEPSTWAMMILGFGLIGGALRRRTKTTARIAFA